MTADAAAISIRCAEMLMNTELFSFHIGAEATHGTAGRIGRYGNLPHGKRKHNLTAFL